MKHGTRRRYEWGCRCEPCIDAYRTYKRESSRRLRRARSKERQEAGGVRIVEGITHGYSGYANQHCRCEVCRDANRRACVEYRRRQRTGVGPT